MTRRTYVMKAHLVLGGGHKKRPPALEFAGGPAGVATVSFVAVAP
jgi:hypothetical protein